LFSCRRKAAIPRPTLSPSTAVPLPLSLPRPSAREPSSPHFTTTTTTTRPTVGPT
jgi:hypothetical protein